MQALERLGVQAEQTLGFPPEKEDFIPA